MFMMIFYFSRVTDLTYAKSAPATLKFRNPSIMAAAWSIACSFKSASDEFWDITGFPPISPN